MDDYTIIYNILMSDDVVSSIKSNIKTLLIIIPEIEPMIGFDHKNKHHHLDVWNHTLLALSLSKKDFITRLSLLLHDIGKPFCYQEENGVRHYKGHPYKSYEISSYILPRLIKDDELIGLILDLIKNHDTSILGKKDILERHDFYNTLVDIQECDTLAHTPSELEKRKEYITKARNLLNEKVMVRKQS